MILSPEIWTPRLAELKSAIAKPKEVDMIEYFVKELKPQTVLEIGCNFGRELKFLSKLSELHGIDYNKYMIKGAKKHIPNGIFHVAEASSLPYSDSSIDMVYTDGLLSHLGIDSVPLAMQEIVRVSKNYILLVEYLGTRLSRNTITNCKQNSWVHDYDKILSVFDVYVRYNQKMFFGTDLYQIILLQKHFIERETFIKERPYKKLEFKIGKLKLEIG